MTRRRFVAGSVLGLCEELRGQPRRPQTVTPAADDELLRTRAALRCLAALQALPFRSADLCGPCDSYVNLLDCAEDHRRGAMN
jgi:hypothetical protein